MQSQIPPLVTVALWTIASACQDPSVSPSTSLDTSTEAGKSNSDRTTNSSNNDTSSSPAQFDKIHSIQGPGATPQMKQARVQAVVTASFQGKDQLRGFFIQEEDQDIDQDPRTSEGIFVYCGTCRTKVKPRDLVQVQGSVTDYYKMTQIDITKGGALKVVGQQYPLPRAVTLSFPLKLNANTKKAAQAQRNALLESKEGMRVQIPQAMSLANIYHLPRYGEITLSSLAIPRQFGDLTRPSKAGFVRHQIQRLATQIRWDDDNNRQNTSTPNKSKTQDQAITHPLAQGFSSSHWLRAGDRVSGLRGVLHWSYAGHKGTDAWRIRSAQETPPKIERSNPRPRVPHLRGDLKIASFNVLNYFSTLDTPESKCGPKGTLGCRGANSAQERTRQEQKLVAAICALKADIVGIIEIENDAERSQKRLTDAINRRCPTYRFVDAGVLGTDAIKVGLIYRPDRVKTQGAAQVIQARAFTSPVHQDRQKNRPALFQTFVDLSSKQSLGIVVNHFKSKGSSCGAGDDDPLRGQGNCNRTRTLAAKFLADWLNEHATQEKLLILGDLNAYRHEDPLRALANSGYVDLVDRHAPEAYTYRFEGEVGTLDYALASPSLASHVLSAAVWHINTDESSLLDYNDAVLDPGERSYQRKSSARALFAPNESRASDHDPIVVGISWRMR